MRSTSGPNRNYGWGIMVLASFGSWWLFLGVRSMGPSVAIPALVVLGGVALFLSGLRLARLAAGNEPAADEASRTARSRAFRDINIVQWAAVGGLIVTLNVTHRTEWILPGIMLIVGLHFFPLARVFHSRDHSLIGGAMCAVAIGYPLVCPQGPLDPIGPIAAGLILWTAALIWALRR